MMVVTMGLHRHGTSFHLPLLLLPLACSSPAVWEGLAILERSFYGRTDCSVNDCSQLLPGQDRFALGAS